MKIITFAILWRGLTNTFKNIGSASSNGKSTNLIRVSYAKIIVDGAVTTGFAMPKTVV
jgi:hypothetical protein